MQRPLPEPVEPVLARSSERSAGRGLVYAGLIVLLAIGGWTRLAGGLPGGAPADQERRLVELKLVPLAQQDAQIQALRLPGSDAAALQQAVSRRRVRLVQMPVFEGDGGTGGLVEVTCGGLLRTVRLGAQPTVLTLPITGAGTVSLRALGQAPPGGLRLVAITLDGPVSLPPLPSGQTIELGVIAQ